MYKRQSVIWSKPSTPVATFARDEDVERGVVRGGLGRERGIEADTPVTERWMQRRRRLRDNRPRRKSDHRISRAAEPSHSFRFRLLSIRPFSVPAPPSIRREHLGVRAKRSRAKEVAQSICSIQFIRQPVCCHTVVFAITAGARPDTSTRMARARNASDRPLRVPVQSAASTRPRT